MGFRRHCQHGSHCLLEQTVEQPVVPTRHCGSVLPLVFSTHTLNSSAASLAAMCHHWPVALFQHSPQIHRNEESRLFPNSQDTGSYIGSIIFQTLLRELAEGSVPQAGCLLCTWRLWELISCSLQGNQSSQDQKSQRKSYQYHEWYDLLHFFCYYLCPGNDCWRKIHS